MYLNILSFAVHPIARRYSVGFNHLH